MTETEEYRKLKTLVRNDPVFKPLKKRKWFIRWLKDNMHIYREFRRLAWDLKTNGRRDRYSARAIIHKMRWDTLFTEAKPNDYKVGDHSTPYMARLVMIEQPLLKGMFKLSSHKKTVGSDNS